MDERLCLAIDLGGSKTVVSVVDSAGKIYHSARRELIGKSYTPNSILAAIESASKEALEFSPDKKPQSVGISIPGPCDSENGVFLANFSTNIQGWHFKRDLEDMFHLPVFGDNDVNACALAEKRFGCCKNTANFIWITLSFGCGGAVYLNDRLYKGRRGLAGEVGHIPVVFDSKIKCGCGVFGDMEAEYSGFALGRKYNAIKGLAQNPKTASKEVGQAARQGDKDAIKLLYEAGYALGRLISMAQNILDLESAVLGGGVCVYEYEFLYPGIAQAIEDCCYPLSKQGFEVHKTALGYNASLLGAAALAL
ncbi:MAG: ROK family protein [Eubacteriales bacterium]|nr:ROK family protein [Eubacteriales bacterium]